MLAHLGAALALAAGAAVPPAPEPEGNEPFLRLYAETRGFRAGHPVRATVAPGGGEVLFLRSGPRSGVQSLFATEVQTGRTRLVLDAEALLAADATAESDAEKARLERQRITARGITHYQLSADGRILVASAAGRSYACAFPGGFPRRLPLPADALDPRLSPDGRLLAYASGGELWVLDLEKGKPRQITRGASGGKTHGLAEFVAQEEMHRERGYWWSPDSRFLAFEEVDETSVEKLYLGDPARPERAPPPIAYPRAGRANAAVRVGVTSLQGGPPTWLEWDRAAYPYLAQVRWERGGPILLLVESRRQTAEVLLAGDPSSGRTRELLREIDLAWLNLHPDLPRWLPDGSGFLWFTERNGATEVELRRPDGGMAASLVPPRWRFVSLVGVDPRTGLVYFVGAPDDPSADRLFSVRPGEEPREIPVRATAPATLAAALAEDGSALVVTAAGAGSPPRTAVAAPDGRELAELPSVALPSPLRARPELRRLGRLGLPTSLVKPTSFRAGAKYPVLVEVYGGPMHLAPLRLQGEAPLSQWYADRGFIVVRIVNRGQTMRLGRDFERAVKGDLSGPALDDQVEALQALAAAVPEMDLSRVGILGWSFGGYMAALAVLRRPDVYCAAVAGAPVADWRDYDTHYAERYLGLPEEAPGAYERSSLLALAPGARRPLLLVHGTADDNVHFLHSLKLADALLRAGRPAALAPLAGVTHLPSDPPTAERLARAEARFLEEALSRPCAGP